MHDEGKSPVVVLCFLSNEFCASHHRDMWRDYCMTAETIALKRERECLGFGALFMWYVEWREWTWYHRAGWCSFLGIWRLEQRSVKERAGESCWDVACCLSGRRRPKI